MPPETYTFYCAGELFSAKHLLGNAALAEAIHALSGGRYLAILPQNLEPSAVTARAIRDTDLRALLECDLGLFHYDGPELDSGTVVEYMFAKFADLPSVLLRTDFRSAGDALGLGGDAWNLMSSFYPRTRIVQLDAMALYKASFPSHDRSEAVAGELLAQKRSTHSGQRMVEEIAAKVIAAFDEVVALPPALPASLTEPVYRWLALLPNLLGTAEANTQAALAACARKRAKGLL